MSTGITFKIYIYINLKFYLKKFIVVFNIINFYFLSIDCESLIRKMLVLEPTKRYTIPQIKRHRWMAGSADTICSMIITRSSSSIQEPNEQILRLMHSLGIDITRTREVYFLFINYIMYYIYILIVIFYL